jgi:hypothetical protein
MTNQQVPQEQLEQVFKKSVAANGRDLNSILNIIDIETITAALTSYIGKQHGNMFLYESLRHTGTVDPNNILVATEQYEKAIVTFRKVTGRSAVAE